MWPFRSSKQPDDDDEESVYTEEEYEEEYEYEVEVTDDEAESSDDEGDGVLVEPADGSPPVEKAGAAVEADPVEEDQPQEEVEDVRDQVDVNVSAITKEEDDDEEESEDESSEEEVSSDEEEEQEDEQSYEEDLSEPEVEEDEEDAVTSIEEKHSLLALAAEHDRVDILQSIMTPEDKDILLNNPIAPPLHVAITFGSVNATTCLLRLGANPALRPDTEHKKIDGFTAWELAFGGILKSAVMLKEETPTGWFTPTKSTKIKPVDMKPSKREGIRHAFTAEALRCIGADDVTRLSQLLESGMPSDLDIGGNKDIVGWCREMGAMECLKAVVVVVEEPAVEEQVVTKDEAGETAAAPPKTPLKDNDDESTSSATRSHHVHRLSSDVNDPESLHNRLEELNTLAVSLSTYLDNLAEEVSVCHGLLLMGNGASALASHVRSLREQQDFLRTDLDDRTLLWESTEQELGAYMRRYKIKGAETKELFAGITTKSTNRAVLSRRLSTDDPVQLRAQLGASENKIRKLRASIADMSDESETAMKEVEKRGLTGGIQLVRKLREQIRELDFQASEAKSGEALCRARLQHLQQQIRTKNEESSGEVAQAEKPAASVPQSPLKEDNDDATTSDAVPHQKRSLTIDLSTSSQPSSTKDPLASIHESVDESPVPAASKSRELSLERDDDYEDEVAISERVATGQSDALMKYQANGGKGYMPLNLWHMLLRIIGIGIRDAVNQNVQDLKKQSSTVMIV
jgi:hypothetical protein